MRARSVLGGLFVLSLLCVIGGAFVARCFGMGSAEQAPAVTASIQPMDLVMLAVIGSGGLMLLIRPRRRQVHRNSRR